MVDYRKYIKVLEILNEAATSVEPPNPSELASAICELFDTNITPISSVAARTLIKPWDGVKIKTWDIVYIYPWTTYNENKSKKESFTEEVVYLFEFPTCYICMEKLNYSDWYIWWWVELIHRDKIMHNWVILEKNI